MVTDDGRQRLVLGDAIETASSVAGLVAQGFAVINANCSRARSVHDALVVIHESFGRGEPNGPLSFDWLDDLLDGEPGFDTSDSCAIALLGIDAVWQADASSAREMIEIICGRAPDYERDGGQLVLVVEVLDSDLRGEMQRSLSRS